MPVYPDAVPVLMHEYETRLWRGIGSGYYEEDGTLVIDSIRIYRRTTYREYWLPYYDDGPDTQQVTTPSGGWEYAGYDNSVRSRIPLLGDHMETFTLIDPTWYNEDGTLYG